jgi:predicted Zn-dependent protease
MSKVLIGRMPECGHIVAIDAHTDGKSRSQMAKQGFDIQTMEIEEAKNLFNQDIAVHISSCQKRKSS